MAFIAEVINVISHLLINDIKREANMFYITPFYETTQPIFNYIALKFGIFSEIIIYLSCISLFAYVLYRLILKKDI